MGPQIFCASLRQTQTQGERERDLIEAYVYVFNARKIFHIFDR